MSEKTFSPFSHPAGVNTHLKLADGEEVKGIVHVFTSDAVLIQTVDELVRVHPHEIAQVVE